MRKGDISFRFGSSNGYFVHSNDHNQCHISDIYATADFAVDNENASGEQETEETVTNTDQDTDSGADMEPSEKVKKDSNEADNGQATESSPSFDVSGIPLAFRNIDQTSVVEHLSILKIPDKEAFGDNDNVTPVLF